VRVAVFVPSAYVLRGATHTVNRAGSQRVTGESDCHFAILRELRRLPDPGVEAVTRIELPIERSELRLRVVQLTDIVFGRIFGAAAVQWLPQLVFDFEEVVALLDNVFLVEHLAQEMVVLQRWVSGSIEGATFP